MTYLVTYAVYNEPHTVECTLKQGRFWNNDAVAIDYKIILHVVEVESVLLPTCIRLPHPKDDHTITITNNSEQPINIIYDPQK